MQQFSYSEPLNAVRTKIHDVFYHPEHKLGWPFKSYGIGLNLNIIQLCREKKADLIVEIESGDIKGTWIVKNEILFNFIESYETEYIVKSHYKLKVIAATYFKWYEGP